MINKYTCSNGVRIVHERMPHMRSVALGVWVDAGSGDELDEEAGIAHFIEHMLFKGTTSRTARMIAEEFDRIGGDLNAFTSKELTCFYTTVLSEHANQALTILEDMLFHSTFAQEEIEKEKSVVLEEIATVEDTPDDDVHEQLWAAMYPNDPIGKAILGNEDSIASFTKQSIQGFMERLYRPERMVISIAGNYDDKLIAFIETLFGSFPSAAEPMERAMLKTPVFHPNISKKIKDIEQAHFCVGFPSLHANDERMYDLVILDSIIGGAMSSRLFQEVREERGLAYSIYSYYTPYANAGAFMIYGGTSPEKLAELNETIFSVIHALKKSGVSEREIENAKEQVKGGFLLGLESTESRMYRNGNNELLFEQHKTADEVVAKIDAVEQVNIQEMIEIIFGQAHAISIIASEETLEGINIR